MMIFEGNAINKWGAQIFKTFGDESRLHGPIIAGNTTMLALDNLSFQYEWGNHGDGDWKKKEDDDAWEETRERVIHWFLCHCVQHDDLYGYDMVVNDENRIFWDYQAFMYDEMRRKQFPHRYDEDHPDNRGGITQRFSLPLPKGRP